MNRHGGWGISMTLAFTFCFFYRFLKCLVSGGVRRWTANQHTKAIGGGRYSRNHAVFVNMKEIADTA
jgi:hypothetical protein